MNKFILLLIFIPLVSFGQTKVAIEQGIKELQSMIPMDNNGMTLVNAINENDTGLVYVYEIQNDNSLNIVKNLINKSVLIKNMISTNGSQFFISNDIIGVWRYYYKKELIKEIKIKPADYNLSKNSFDIELPKNYGDVVEKSFDSDDFDMYVDKFYRDVNNYGLYPIKPKKIIIKFSYFDRIKHATHLHGVSLGYNNDDLIEIYINKSSWDALDRAGKFRLMYHELGHDVLNLDDLDKTNTELDAIMYPSFSSNQKMKMDTFIDNLNVMLESYQKK